MVTAKILNGPDHWMDAVGEAWSFQWLKCQQHNTYYLWRIIGTELHQSARSMGCEHQRFLSEIAYTHAEMIGNPRERQAS